MFRQNYEIILASSSPRRQHFLQELGISFSVSPATIDETPLPNEHPEDFVRRMAENKIEKITCDHPDSCVISADTIVCLGPTILGKPKNEKEALKTLQLLNGKTHRVITAVCLSISSRKYWQSFSEETTVTFGNFNKDFLIQYIETKDPFDKAGGYGIQSFGGVLIQSIHGSYSNVVGLPVPQLVHTLRAGKIIY